MASTTPVKTYKAKVNIVVDTETLALDSKAAVVDIGAVMAMGKFEPCQFQLYIKPSSYVGTPFEIDADTLEWHEKQNPGYLDKCEELGVSFQEAAHEFHTWLSGFAANAELHMWAQGKDFDQTILGYLFKTSGIEKTAYSYRNFHCTRDLLFLNPGARIKGGQDEAAHTALADAIWAAKQFNAIVDKSSWYQRLFA
jgi:hypothetical protein